MVVSLPSSDSYTPNFPETSLFLVENIYPGQVILQMSANYWNGQGFAKCSFESARSPNVGENFGIYGPNIRRNESINVIHIRPKHRFHEVPHVITEIRMILTLFTI
uniref:Uncharacterized protein n=1 Tax=Strigamia maritima TaxID=126957 RepID=T1JNE5_STRMM